MIDSTTAGAGMAAARCWNRYRPLCAGEAAAGDRRGLLVQLGALADWLQERLAGDVLALLPGGRGLHLGDPLGGQLVGVLVLDLLQPGGTLGRLGGVDVDPAAVERLVDLLEQGVDELGL